MPETAAESRPDDGPTTCLPWLLRMDPHFYVEVAERPCGLRRLALWAVFGFTYVPNPNCPLPGFAPRRQEPGGDDDPGWMDTRRRPSLARTPAGVVLRYA